MNWGTSEDDPEEPEGSGGGWVPPEARTWRHPSELHVEGVAAVISAAPGWRRSAALAVGGVAMLAIAAGALLLASTGSSRPTTVTLDTMPIGTAAVTPCCTLGPDLTRDAEQAVVTIEPTVGPGATGCGVVVADQLVATTVAALGGGRNVRVTAATGRLLTGEAVAVDRNSGVVLLRISEPLPPAPMDDGASLGSGTPALTVGLRPGPDGGAPKPAWSSGTVVSVGEPTPGGSATSMAQITVRGSSMPAMQGEPLLDQHGLVEGILDGARGADRLFLPMSLVVGVSNDLQTLGKVRHGWLGVTDSTLGAGPGAKVVWVDPSGAAAHTLQAGDVILRVDGWQVHSAADLRSMLYVMAPGTKVAVEARRGTHVVHAVVQLAPSP